MKMRKFAGFMLAGTMLLSTLSGCGSTIVDQAGSAGAESAASSEQTQSTEDKTDLTEKVSLKINYAAGNKSRTITYNQECRTASTIHRKTGQGSAQQESFISAEEESEGDEGSFL